MNTDIEQLHKVINGEVHGRGCGKTFAQCHNVAGAIELGFKNVFLIVSMYRDLKYIVPMLEKVFEDHNIKINHVSYQNKEIVIDKCIKVKFITEDEIDEKTRGYGDVFIVYMRHWD